MATKVKTYKFPNLNQVQLFLDGGLMLGPVPPVGLPLIGRQLKFTSPSTVTVTFARRPDADGAAGSDLLQLRDIKQQIETAIPAVHVALLDQKLTLKETTITNGVTLTAPADPTLDARPMLGADARTDAIGQVISSATGSVPRLADMYGVDGYHILFIAQS